MMKPFIHDDFLLDTDEARELYHVYAEGMPIIDYHCHLQPAEIAQDRRWANLTELWLGADHYKWRQMRTCGFAERFCSGRGPDGAAAPFERFSAYAATMERLVGNPLFDWSQLELARYFGITERLCEASAPRIWEACNQRLADADFSAQALVRRSNVRVLCTTDDPVDPLDHHAAIAANPFGVQVRPAWRSDRASKLANLPAWNAWVDALATAAGMPVRTWEEFLAALAVRHAFFAKAGCVVSDYGLTEIVADPYDEATIAHVFAKARRGEAPTRTEMRAFQSAWLFEGLKADAAAGWTAQLHFGCLRDVNGAAASVLGPDTGFDTIGDAPAAEPLARLFDRLERADALPRCILYSLHPKDLAPLAALIGCFQKGPVAGKLQLGSAWWFLDQKDGMTRQLETLSSLGALGTFVGMLTDSRSFISYPRHEYFRRILCRKLGAAMSAGDLPHDLPWIGGIVRDIAFRNANDYFGFDCPLTD